MRVLSVSMFSLVLGMCPTSPVPIARVDQTSFEPALIGMWADAAAKSPDTLVVVEFRTPEYYVELTTKGPGEPASADPNDKPRFRERAYISKIGGVSFMNLQELSYEKTGYTVFRFRIAGDTLFVNELKEAAYKFHTSGDFKRYIARNLSNPAIYDKDERFVRVHK